MCGGGGGVMEGRVEGFEVGVVALPLLQARR